MEKLTRGQLRVICADKVYTFGSPSIYSAQYPNPNPGAPFNKATDELRVELTVVNDAFWIRMLLLSDLGFSEAYMIGDIEVDNLDAMFQVSTLPLTSGPSRLPFALNDRTRLSSNSLQLAPALHSQPTGPRRALHRCHRYYLQRPHRPHEHQIRKLARKRPFQHLVRPAKHAHPYPPRPRADEDSFRSAHYDISNVMFESFLSKDMTYSCAIFGPEEGGPEGDLPHVKRKVAAAKGVDELELAQMRKLRTIIDRACISKGDRVLEIGSGWGSLAMEVSLGAQARRFGVRD